MPKLTFGRDLRHLFGKRTRFSFACIHVWLNKLAVYFLWTAIALLFCLMILFYPTRGLLCVLFLLFLALIGFCCM